MRRMALLIAALIVAMLLPFTVQAGPVKLVWDPNGEADLAGYKMYAGTASGVYGAPTTLAGTPSAPTYTATGLKPGVKYYFAVTAYNAAGVESGFSNEVNYTVGDLNLDGAVNVLDLQVMINVIQGMATNDKADLNDDKVVNVLDLQILVGVILSQG